jgi:hypothetical protein
MAERKLGKNVDALHHFRAYVADPNARADRKAFAQTELLNELNDLTAHVTVKAPEGAVVTIDGAPVATAAVVDVEPGMHSIAINGAPALGGPAARAIDAAAGSTVQVDFTPAPPLTTAAAAPPPSPPIVPAVTAPSSESSPSSSRTWAVASMGGGSVLLLAGGIAFASLASLDRTRAERLYSQMQNDNLSCAQSGTICKDHDSASAAADRESAAATTMFVLSGVLAGATIATWLLWPAANSKSKAATTTTTTPAASVAFTKDGGSIVMTGRF